MKSKKMHTLLLVSLLAVGGTLGVPAFAQSDLLPPPFEKTNTQAQAAPANAPTVEYLSEDELERAYQKARQNFGQDTIASDPSTAENTTPSNEQPGQVPQMTGGNDDTPGRVIPLEYPDGGDPIAVVPTGVGSSTVPVGKVRVSVDLENMPLEKVMDNVVETVSKRSGQWKVRWRLKTENQRLRTERVNINAETDFETFMAYLMERVNNMTGIQLLVKVFEGSRLIIIADTY